jgi:hypothetical protein
MKEENITEFLETKAVLGLVAVGTLNNLQKIKKIIAKTDVKIIYQRFSMNKLYICEEKEYQEQLEDGQNDTC